MGNREDLLAGAKSCLVTLGWSNTTVRDIAAAAGVSHAAIGYHFGSREQLLVQALIEAVDELDSRIQTQNISGPPRARWTSLVNTFATDRALWVAQLEAIVAAERHPELRAHLAAAQHRAREGMGGSVPLAILNGVMLQWLIDEEHAPSGASVASEIRQAH